MTADQEVISKLVQFARFTLGIVWERVLLLGGLLLCACAFGYALWRADTVVSLTACAFAMIVYWPLVSLEKNRSKT